MPAAHPQRAKPSAAAPTAWDAWSARALVDAGFEAISIGSHPLAESRGQGDNEAMSLDDAMEGIARITASVDVPVTADVESGYGAAPAELHGGDPLEEAILRMELAEQAGAGSLYPVRPPDAAALRAIIAQVS